MKKILLRNGFYAAITMIGIFTLSFTLGKKLSYETQEVLGYAGIVISLVFVYFGIRQYRDQVNGGTLSFGQGLKVGMTIVLLPALLFGVFDVLYTKLFNPGFWDKYGAAELAKMKASLPAAQYEVTAREMTEQMEFFKNAPFFQFLIMFLTVVAVGLIITVISSLLLKRNSLNSQTR